eukprot:GILJ01032643.1.p1 GENE.GILJ01032643.1~~GILJ01032643.1.p1  ORF type:complete len:164 (+),score=15.18 GILJ01032643.1:124-615(+)
MPLRQHQKLPATWRILLNDYSQRDVGAGGGMSPIHRPFGGNINDFRYRDGRHEYAVMDGAVTGSAVDDAVVGSLARVRPGAKRFRKRSELNSLADVRSTLSRPVAEDDIAMGNDDASNKRRLLNPLHYLPMQHSPKGPEPTQARQNQAAYPREIPRAEPTLRV